MKRLFMAVVCVAIVLSAAAQRKAPKLDYVNALDLTMIGKLCETTNPYHRMETEKVEGISKGEAHLLKMTSGLAIAFRTNAKAIYVKARYGKNTIWNQYAPLTSTQGFNLFIKDAEGEWTWAASRAHKITPHPSRFDKMAEPLHIISGLYEGEKECLLYLPLFSELEGLEIGITPGADIEKMPNPFRYNIAVFGSSFTHGSCASGAGLTWPAFLSRSTDWHICSFGMSGNSKLQPYLGRCSVRLRLMHSSATHSQTLISHRFRIVSAHLSRLYARVILIFLLSSSILSTVKAATSLLAMRSVRRIVFSSLRRFSLR